IGLVAEAYDFLRGYIVQAKQFVPGALDLNLWYVIASSHFCVGSAVCHLFRKRIPRSFHMANHALGLNPALRTYPGKARPTSYHEQDYRRRVEDFFAHRDNPKRR